MLRYYVHRAIVETRGIYDDSKVTTDEQAYKDLIAKEYQDIRYIHEELSEDAGPVDKEDME